MFYLYQARKPPFSPPLLQIPFLAMWISLPQCRQSVNCSAIVYPILPSNRDGDEELQNMPDDIFFVLKYIVTIHKGVNSIHPFTC